MYSILHKLNGCLSSANSLLRKLLVIPSTSIPNYKDMTVLPISIEEKTVLHEDGSSRLYRVNMGVCYNILTPVELVRVLETVRIQDIKIRLFYGNTIHFKPAGLDWMYDEANAKLEGFICRSNNPNVSVPLILSSLHAKQGICIIPESIVKVINARTKEVLYQHPNYHYPRIAIRKIEKGYQLWVGEEMRYTYPKHRYALRWATTRHLIIAHDDGE